MFWLATLIACSLLEHKAIKTDFWNTYFFITLQMPLYALVMFGSYALCSIGWHLMVLEDCTDAHRELVAEVALAKSELKRKGVKL